MQDALAGHDEGGGAQAHPLFLRHIPHAPKGFLHDAHQARIDLVFATEKAGEILHLLEAAHSDAADLAKALHGEACGVDVLVDLACGPSAAAWGCLTWSILGGRCAVRRNDVR